MDVFCDRLNLCSTAAPDCQTGQKKKADIANKSSHSCSSHWPNQLKVVFGQTKKQSTLDFCPRPAKKEMNLHIEKLRAYCPNIYTVSFGELESRFGGALKYQSCAL